MSLRIGFNMWPFSSTRAGGSLYYAASLLREFARICPENILLLYGRHGRDLLHNNEEFHKVQRIELKNFQQIFASRSRFDVLFTPGSWRWFNMPDFPTVNYIPDIQEYYYPDFFSRLELLDRHHYRPYLVQSSTLVITLSHHSKENIVEKLEADRQRIRVVYPGCEPIFQDVSNPGTKPESLPHDLPPYLFYPANSWKHKNHLSLLDALAIVRNKYGIEIPCIFTGHLLSGEFNNVNVPGEIVKRDLQDQVRHIGRVSLSQLKYLYANGMALILPSLFEGFGIPIVEAMACGCPVIASNRTSVPEIAGEAALYFDPEDPEDIAQRIGEFLQNKDGVNKRVANGKIRAANFSYRRQAEEHLSVLEEACRTHQNKIRKPKAVPENRDVRKDSLGLIFVLDSFTADETAKRILKFQSDFSLLVETVIVLKNGTSSHLQDKLKKAGRVVVASDFHSAVRQALGILSSSFVMFSDGKVYPLKAFIQQVATATLNLDECAQLFHGDSYYTDPRYQKTWSDILPSGTQSDDRSSYCEKNLCFIVKKHSILELMHSAQTPFSSLKQLTRASWDKFVKQRVYEAFSARIVSMPVWINASPTIFVARIFEHYQGPGLAAKILHWHAVRSLLAAGIGMFIQLPVRFQLKLQGIYKIVAAARSSGSE